MLKIIGKNFLWLVVLVVVSGCADASDFRSGKAPQVPGGTAADASGQKSAALNIPVQDRKIIKTGEIRFQCSNPVDTRNRIDAAIKKSRGYVSKENSYNYEERIEQRIVIRVPAENFDKLTAEISAGAKELDSKHIEARDVTEEYLDIEVRIKIKKETENRYLELLARAKTVPDILAIEKQIGELRTEIESIEGRLKYLRDRVSFSTLTVNFYQEISTATGFASHFKKGLKNGWNGLIWFLVGLINIWPFLVILVIVALLIIHRKKRKPKAASPADSAKAKPGKQE